MEELKKIVPITELRRNFGEITENLAKMDYLILTKGGEPFAILSSVPKEKKKVLLGLAGSFKGTELDNDKLWNKVFTRVSRKSPIKL